MIYKIGKVSDLAKIPIEDYAKGYLYYYAKECNLFIERYEKDFGARIIILNNKVLEISSTEVREALKQGKDVSRYLSHDVEVYIREHSLYL